MTITFFKQQELIDEHNLMSVAFGEDRLATATKAVYSYYDSLIANINNNIKAIVGGWRRGYSPETVADHLFDIGFTTMSIEDYGVKDTDLLIQAMYVKMGYSENKTWAMEYNYTPSLEERLLDPLDVQLSINERARNAATIGSFETIYFGYYHNNTGAIQKEEEAAAVREFRTAVASALAKRQGQFFTVTVEDTENV